MLNGCRGGRGEKEGKKAREAIDPRNNAQRMQSLASRRADSEAGGRRGGGRGFRGSMEEKEKSRNTHWRRLRTTNPTTAPTARNTPAKTPTATAATGVLLLELGAVGGPIRGVVEVDSTCHGGRGTMDTDRGFVWQPHAAAHTHSHTHMHTNAHAHTHTHTHAHTHKRTHT